jgi:chaperone protein EcpD
MALCAISVILILCGGSKKASAGIVISGTRVIYPERQHEVTIKVSNEGEMPELVQAWIDAGNMNAAPDDEEVPFTLMPPLFRLDPGKGQALRIIYTQDPLPTDKESVFWLNVLEIPPRAQDADNVSLLELAFRSRIKLFYRPQGLEKEGSHDAPGKVQWQLRVGEHPLLEATNPTPYHVTLTKVIAYAGTLRLSMERGEMIGPGETKALIVDPVPTISRPLTRVDYTFINDYGAAVDASWFPPQH